jgi:primosomal protein N' (replication factor Y)
MSPLTSKTLFDETPDEAADDRTVIRVALDTGADSLFDYAVPPAIGAVEPGRRVLVPFGKGNEPVQGFCVAVLDGDQRDKSRRFKLKAVKKLPDSEPLLNDQLLKLAQWISDYYVCPLGQVLAAMVPGAVKKDIGRTTEVLVYLAEQNPEILSALHGAKQKAIVSLLTTCGAVEESLALSQKELLDRAACKDAPLKNLSRRGIVKFVRREVLHSPPIVPKQFWLDEHEVVLNDDQRKALDQIVRGIDAQTFGVTLLYGVTDSGKTEVYIRAIERTIAAGKGAIVLLPEIALTAQTVERFSRRFSRIAVMHCRLTAAQRNAQWRQIREGLADVVIGARSAVFAPLPQLGLIVVDEEHEPSYKQDTVPRYHGRDAAIKRAQLAGAHCILGSATPSLESLFNSRVRGHYQLARLPHRVTNLPMPRMRLVDMLTQRRGQEVTLLSDVLEEQIRLRLARKEQVILLLNRRGYSNFVYCPSCHYSLQCRNCDVTLTFHKRGRDESSAPTVLGDPITGGYAICHYCLSKTLVPQACPLCGKRVVLLGIGSQRLTEELHNKIPAARVMRVDSDAMEGASADEYYRMLDQFASGKIDILAGTQMLAKGLHFPNVTLVGIVSADTCLAMPDFRANERTFQLLSQVAGRAGRAEKPGEVVVQTFLPDQPAIQFAVKYDYEGFIRAELDHREKCCLPPFWRMAIVHLRDESFERLTAACEAMKGRIDEIVARKKLDIKVRGPMPATISRIQRAHRMQIILQAPTAAILQQLFADLRACPPLRPAVGVYYDVDPVNLS